MPEHKQPWKFGKQPDGSHYGIILSDTRFGDQDTIVNFPTRQDAHRYGQAEARRLGFGSYLLFHVNSKDMVEWKTRHYIERQTARAMKEERMF